MAQPRRNKSLVVALYLNATILFAILAVMLSRPGAPGLLPSAFGAPLGQPIAGGGTLYLMPAQFSPQTYGAYVMDIDKQTLVAYQFYPGEKQLRFVAARRFSHDLRMTEFNTIPPVEDVKKMIEAQDAGIRGLQPEKIPLKPQDDPDGKK
jgi:hypothetical protein